MVAEHDLCEITFKLPDAMRSGWFPVQTKLGDLIYPMAGRTRAWGFEIDALRSFAPDAVTIVSLVQCQQVGQPFTRMAEIYEMRRAEQDPCLKMLLKLLMNSCYGQFGLREFPISAQYSLKELERMQHLSQL